jgi:hypothetical protein
MTINQISNQFVKDLTDTFVTTVLQSAQDEAAVIFRSKMQEFDIPALLQQQITATVIPFFTEEIKKKMEKDVEDRLAQTDIVGLINKFIVSVVAPRLEKQSKEQLTAEVSQKLIAIDIAGLAQQQTALTIKEMIKTLSFPEWSIPGMAINPSTLKLSGNNINGGIIKHLESTGIQDRATRCQVTILDTATVFENRLVAAGLEITGNVTVKGNMSVEGTLPKGSPFVAQIVDIVVDKFNQQYDQGTFDQYTARVLDQINENGIDAGVVNVNGKSLIKDNTLAESVVVSNLQKVGALKELQVVGETLLDQTLYVSNGRVGFNTTEPERVFDLWDQEVQIVAGKKKKDTAVFGTVRGQDLIISANNRDQLLIGIDGSVTVNNLNIGRTNHTSASRMPTDNRPVAQIVWNEAPVVGGPIGWVSLGGARWAKFGIIS